MSKARELANLGNAYSDGALSNRNMVTNGSMIVAQRGTSVTNTGAADFNTVDRFQYAAGSGGGSVAYTMSQSTEAPDGFANSFKLEVTTTDTLTGGENTLIRTRLEGQDVQRFNFGSSNAESVTLSFYVRSSETGTYGVQLMAGPSGNTTALQTYTVNSANTWEYKTLTFVGATGYTIPNDTSRGFDVNFMLDSGPDDLIAPYTFNDGQGGSFKAPTGQVNFSQTSGNTFYLTGVSLEVGDTATPFEHPRSYGDELARCQRYYSTYAYPNTNARHYGVSDNFGYYQSETTFPVTMRATPSAVQTSTPTYDGCDNLRPQFAGNAGAVFLIDLDGNNKHFYAKDYAYAFDAEL